MTQVEKVLKYYCSRKILLISHQLSRTGAPIALLNVARLLREEGNDLTLISLEEGPLRDEFESIGVEVAVENEILKKWETFDWIQNLNVACVNRKK